MLPPHSVASQLKILMPVGTEITIVGEGEEGVWTRAHADGEHVVRPDTEADEADANRGGDHRRIAEDRFAREDGDDLVGEGESGQDEDVDLGMAEDPEEVHPENGGAAGLRVEEVAAQIAIDAEHDLRGRERADGDEDQAAGDEIKPDQQRHAAQLHAGAAHAERGGDDVERQCRCVPTPLSKMLSVQ